MAPEFIKNLVAFASEFRRHLTVAPENRLEVLEGLDQHLIIDTGEALAQQRQLVLAGRVADVGDGGEQCAAERTYRIGIGLGIVRPNIEQLEQEVVVGRILPNRVVGEHDGFAALNH